MQPQPGLLKDSGDKEAGGPPAGVAADTNTFKRKSILASSTGHLKNINFLVVSEYSILCGLVDARKVLLHLTCYGAK